MNDSNDEKSVLETLHSLEQSMHEGFAVGTEKMDATRKLLVASILAAAGMFTMIFGYGWNMSQRIGLIHTKTELQALVITGHIDATTKILQNLYDMDIALSDKINSIDISVRDRDTANAVSDAVRDREHRQEFHKNGG